MVPTAVNRIWINYGFDKEADSSYSELDGEKKRAALEELNNEIRNLCPQAQQCEPWFGEGLLYRRHKRRKGKEVPGESMCTKQSGRNELTGWEEGND